jgi:hypothetical protein
MRKQHHAPAQRIGQVQTAVPLGTHRGGLIVAMTWSSAVVMVCVKLQCVGATLGGLEISARTQAQTRLISKPLRHPHLRHPQLSVSGVNGAYGVHAPQHAVLGHKNVAERLIFLTANLLQALLQIRELAS